jgi:hypothetical protein
MTLKETGLVLCNIGTGAGSQDRNLLLNFLNIIFTGFEIDLGEVKGQLGTIGRIERAYVFNGNNLAVGLVNCFVHSSKTAACKRDRVSQMQNPCQGEHLLPSSSITW